MGLPDIEVFAFRLTAVVLAGLAGLALVFGWWVMPHDPTLIVAQPSFPCA